MIYRRYRAERCRLGLLPACIVCAGLPNIGGIPRFDLSTIPRRQCARAGDIAPALCALIAPRPALAPAGVSAGVLPQPRPHCAPLLPCPAVAPHCCPAPLLPRCCVDAQPRPLPALSPRPFPAQPLAYGRDRTTPRHWYYATIGSIDMISLGHFRCLPFGGFRS